MRKKYNLVPEGRNEILEERLRSFKNERPEQSIVTAVDKKCDMGPNIFFEYGNNPSTVMTKDRPLMLKKN